MGQHLPGACSSDPDLLILAIGGPAAPMGGRGAEDPLPAARVTHSHFRTASSLPKTRPGNMCAIRAVCARYRAWYAASSLLPLRRAHIMGSVLRRAQGGNLRWSLGRTQQTSPPAHEGWKLVPCKCSGQGQRGAPHPWWQPDVEEQRGCVNVEREPPTFQSWAKTTGTQQSLAQTPCGTLDVQYRASALSN